MDPAEKFPEHLYYDIPHATAGEYVELAREMLRVRLPDMPAHVDALADELERVTVEAEAALVEHADQDPEREAREIGIERWTDTLASMIQGSLGFWSFYKNPHVNERFSDDEKAKIELEDNRKKAVRAEAAYEGMFGADGRGFFLLSYPERFRALSAMLRTLAKDDLGGDFKELLHEPLRVRVEAFSVSYEQQVEAHRHERDESRSLGRHRAALRWAIAHYTHEVRETADRWSQDSCDRVNTAVQPLQDWAQRMKQRH